MKIMTLVTSNRPGITFASHHSSFTYDVLHNVWYLLFFTRFHISIISPVSSYKTTLSICIGSFIPEIFYGVTFSCAVSTHAIIASWVNDQKFILILVLYCAACCASLWLLIVSDRIQDSLWVKSYV